MIKINLAARKTASLMDGPGGGGGKSRLTNIGGMTKFDLSQLKDLPNLRQLVILLLVGYFGNYFLEDLKSEELKKADNATIKLKGEQGKLKTELEQTKKYEGIKKALEGDEIVIRTKLDTIQKLLQDRTTPPKLLVAVSSAIPKEVWLSSIKVEDAAISLQGDSLDFNQVSDFMKNLNESAFFKDVALKNTQQGKDESGLETAKFELSMKRR